MKRVPSVIFAVLAVALGLLVHPVGAAPRRDPTDPENPRDPGPKVPPGSLPPTAPTLAAGDREGTSLSVTFRDRSTNESGFELSRKGPGEAAYRVVASWGAVTGSGGSRTHVSSGLRPDSPYRYRVRAKNAKGGSSQSEELLLYTRDGDDNEVWRAELILETANVADADTDDEVHASLNPGNTSIVPRGNSTWLDYPRDDFERGRRESYDLNVNGVSELSDITHVYVSKNGDDAWCLRSLALRVNNQQVYDQSFASEPGGCRWLDDDDGHRLQFAVSHAGLRAHAAWGRYNHDTALASLGLQGIPNPELVSRFEGIVGDAIRGNEAYWGKISGAAVEVTRGCPASQANCQKLRVDLDLAASVPGPNPEVDIDFDVDVACKDGDLDIHTDNFKVNADSSVLWELTTLGLIELLDNRIDDEVRDGFEAIDRSIKDVGSCRVFVDGNAGLRLEQARAATGVIRMPAARL